MGLQFCIGIKEEQKFGLSLGGTLIAGWAESNIIYIKLQLGIMLVCQSLQRGSIGLSIVHENDWRAERNTL